MTLSQKQLEANRRNAKKAGVKTPEGKAIVKYNALKHGLLAKEAVVTVGEGAEDPEEFNALLQDLKTQLAPVGTLEDMLVEKIAVAYWRLRRACRYEAGLIRRELDTATDDYYDQADWQSKKKHKTDEEIAKRIQEEANEKKRWNSYKRRLCRMRTQGKPLEATFELDEMDGPWDWLHDKYSCLLPRNEEGEVDCGTEDFREYLINNLCWTKEDGWDGLIGICDEKVRKHENVIATHTKEKRKNELTLQAIRMLGNIPSKDELDRLLRYEGAIERQFYKALNHLERLQRLRAGDSVPAPVEVEVGVNSGQNS